MRVPHFKATFAALAILVLASSGEARITRLVIEHTETLGNGGYQKLTGHAYGELDPKLPLNAIISDLARLAYGTDSHILFLQGRSRPFYGACQYRCAARTLGL